MDEQPTSTPKQPINNPSSNETTTSYLYLHLHPNPSVPWQHTGVEIKDIYSSIKPKQPDLNPDFDEDDLPYRLHILLQSTMMMVSSEIVLGKKEDEVKYVHDELPIPITEQQKKGLIKLLLHDQKAAANGKLKYSIFSWLGKSCALQAQDCIEYIAQGTEEEALARVTLLEKITGITLPGQVFIRAKNIVEARENPAAFKAKQKRELAEKMARRVENLRLLRHGFYALQGGPSAGVEGEEVFYNPNLESLKLAINH